MYAYDLTMFNAKENLLDLHMYKLIMIYYTLNFLIHTSTNPNIGLDLDWGLISLKMISVDIFLPHIYCT